MDWPSYKGFVGASFRQKLNHDSEDQFLADRHPNELPQMNLTPPLARNTIREHPIPAPATRAVNRDTGVSVCAIVQWCYHLPRVHVSSLHACLQLEQMCLIVDIVALGFTVVAEHPYSAEHASSHTWRNNLIQRRSIVAQAPAKTTIQEQFEETFAASFALHKRARHVIPGGITHDGRRLSPFPVSIERADGAHKWDVDGHELIDFGIGHGSLILGHNRPEIVEALQKQATRGTHFSAGHEAEVAWAEKITELVPSAEQVRFTGSGTESTMLAIRLARAVTGRTTVVKFGGHFHGWNDFLLKGEKAPFNDPNVVGIPSAVLDTIHVIPANDPDVLETRLAQGDVAAVIMEPTGGSWSEVPLITDFLQRVRDITATRDAVLIFDEVISGFRWSPGGAQQRFGVTPDLTTLAKIVAGGLPGGAVAGKREIMDVLAFRDDSAWNATNKVRHNGTYNSNPMTAAAGLACLTICSDSAVQQYCDELAKKVRIGLNQVFEARNVRGFAWGESSTFHTALGETCTNRTSGDLRYPEGVSSEALKMSGATRLATSLAQGMLLEGVDLFSGGGMLSTSHTEADIEHTVNAMDRVLDRMEDEGLPVFG
jgi:glutamate-1-semialdehyde 2,1-aminomutase